MKDKDDKVTIIYKVQCICCREIEDSKWNTTHHICRACQSEIKRFGDWIHRKYKICYVTGKPLEMKGIPNTVD